MMIAYTFADESRQSSLWKTFLTYSGFRLRGAGTGASKHLVVASQHRRSQWKEQSIFKKSSLKQWFASHFHSIIYSAQ